MLARSKVDVVQLRNLGVRRRPDEARSARPVRGVLSLGVKSPLWQREGSPRLLAVLVAEDQPDHVLEPLDYARVTKIRRGSFLIVGVQQYKLPVHHFEDHKQAWWVRPVGQPVSAG